MRSRAARLTLKRRCVDRARRRAALLFLVSTEQPARSPSRRTALRTFDRRAREAADLLADARAGQQACVAAGSRAPPTGCREVAAIVRRGVGRHRRAAPVGYWRTRRASR